MHDRLFLDHRKRRGKAHVMMISAIDGEMVSQSEGEPDLNQRAVKVQEFFKFKSFYE